MRHDMSAQTTRDMGSGCDAMTLTALALSVVARGAGRAVERAAGSCAWRVAGSGEWTADVSTAGRTAGNAAVSAAGGSR